MSNFREKKGQKARGKKRKIGLEGGGKWTKCLLLSRFLLAGCPSFSLTASIPFLMIKRNHLGHNMPEPDRRADYNRHPGRPEDGLYYEQSI
jgi:hypothetical protein